ISESPPELFYSYFLKSDFNAPHSTSPTLSAAATAAPFHLVAASGS
uniref:Uncharacterized protein n=1 Tax=Loxodonta africana TaxID=9785 RepID=G3U0K7_LOXAF